ncbi:MAG: translation elongation factor Ts [Bacteroidota bacterium]
MAITAQDVNKLRQTTGAGMMDCKNALVEANGDFEVAIDILRKKGQKVANKRADRDTAEGAVIAKTNENSTKGVVVMLNCETDFVAKNDEYVRFTTAIADAAIDSNVTTIDDLLNVTIGGLPISEKINEMVGKIGEKLQIGAFHVIESAQVFAYIHPGNRLASLIGISKNSSNYEEMGKNLTMQIAAMAPVSIDESDINPEILVKEKEIAMDLARNEGKPENMLEKIAMGRVSKFIKESTLLNQEFIKDGKMTVAQYISSIDKDINVTSINRVAVG